MKQSLSTENTAAATLRPLRNGSLVNTPVHRHGITVDTMSLQSFHDAEQSASIEKSHRLASDDSLSFETPDSSFDSPPEMPSPPIPPRQVLPQRPPPPQRYAAAINHSTKSSAQSHTSDSHLSLLPLSSSLYSSSGTNYTPNTSNFRQSPISRYSPSHCPPLKPARTIGKGGGSGFESDFVDANTSSFTSNQRLMEPSSAAMRSSSGSDDLQSFGRVEVCVK